MVSYAPRPMFIVVVSLSIIEALRLGLDVCLISDDGLLEKNVGQGRELVAVI